MDEELQENLRKYLVNRHREELLNVLANLDSTQNYSIFVNFITLFEDNITIGNGLLIEPEKYLSALNCAALSAQKHILNEEESQDVQFKVKTKVTVRIVGLPAFGDSGFPSNNDIGFLVQINGTLIKAGSPKLLEYQRDYICLKCDHVVTLKASYEKYYTITVPSKCEECRSTNIKPKSEVDVLYFIDYQEVKVQEHFGKSRVGTVPKSILVTLEGNLVDSCKPGDNVIITGILLRRWKPVKPGVRYEIDLVLKANNLEVCNEQKSLASNKGATDGFTGFWQNYEHQELMGRNHILRSFCPQIFGLHLAKLAMATILAGGVQKVDDNDTSARSMSHLLLVGDAGTGKSHLLRYAARISNRSVFTTGVGSTTAGLTVTALRESGDWNLEAGALVLADGGLCCIDDFNSIREHDRASIHEAMEQQSISVAKAGIVTKLRTRCSILATANTKGKYDSSMPMSVNVSISSPLLSRFDIVLVLLDSKNPDWDRSLCNFVFDDKKMVNSSQEQKLKRPNYLSDSTWSVIDIQNYFTVIKGLNPIMSAEAGTVLRSYYQFQRMAGSRNAARTTVRLLESLIRLSQGHARLMFREKVTVLDAITAITLIESSLYTESFCSQTNVLHTVVSEKPYEEYQAQAEVILTKLKLFNILENEMQRIKGEKTYFTDKTIQQDKETTEDNFNEFTIYENQTKSSPSSNRDNELRDAVRNTRIGMGKTHLKSINKNFSQHFFDLNEISRRGPEESKADGTVPGERENQKTSVKTNEKMISYGRRNSETEANAEESINSNSFKKIKLDSHTLSPLSGLTSYSQPSLKKFLIPSGGIEAQSPGGKILSPYNSREQSSVCAEVGKYRTQQDNRKPPKSVKPFAQEAEEDDDWDCLDI